MSTCTIVSTPETRMNPSAPSPRPTNLQIAAARRLAAAFHHGWSCDPLAPTDAELINLGLVEADRLWGSRVTAAEGEGAGGYLGLSPQFDNHGNLVHTSGSGTVAWVIEPSGAVQIVVRGTVNPPDGGRQTGPIVYRALVVPPNPMVPGGALVGGMISPTSAWPEDGYAKDVAGLALWALGFKATSLEPWVRPLPKPTLSAGPVRKL